MGWQDSPGSALDQGLIFFYSVCPLVSYRHDICQNFYTSLGKVHKKVLFSSNLLLLEGFQKNPEKLCPFDNRGAGDGLKKRKRETSLLGKVFFQ